MYAIYTEFQFFKLIIHLYILFEQYYINNRYVNFANYIYFLIKLKLFNWMIVSLTSDYFILIMYLT